MSNVTLAGEHRRYDRLSTCFYHSLAPTGAWRRFLLFSMITSLILLLIAGSRSSMFWPILDLDLIKDLRRGVTHARSRNEMQTVLNGMHLSMCLWIRVSKLFTASSRSFVPRTQSQVSPASSKYNDSFRCFLRSRMRIFWRTGLSFDPAGEMTAVWPVFIDNRKWSTFPKQVRSICKDIIQIRNTLSWKIHQGIPSCQLTKSIYIQLVSITGQSNGQWSIQGVDLHRWCKPLRWGNPPVHIISHFNF